MARFTRWLQRFGNRVVTVQSSITSEPWFWQSYPVALEQEVLGRRCLGAAVTQDLTDFRRRGISQPQLRCRRMTQAIGVDASQICAFGCIRHDAAHTGSPKCMMGRKMPDEYGPAQGVCRPGVAQTICQSAETSCV